RGPQPERARERRSQALAMRAEEKVIWEKESPSAERLPLGNVAKPPVSARPRWFLARLERELASDLPGVDLREDRIAVFTELDAEFQIAAESAVRDGLKELEAA